MLKARSNIDCSKRGFELFQFALAQFVGNANFCRGGSFLRSAERRKESLLGKCPRELQQNSCEAQGRE
jgi:hypothetical protein